MNNLSTIWTPSNCLSKNQLISYIEQKLDRDEVYLVESHLNDCELCSEALDGLMDEKIEQTQSQLADIKSTIEKKIRETETEKAALLLHQKKNPEKKPVQLKTTSNRKSRWMIAASLLLLVGLGGYSVFSYLKDHEEQLAKNENASGKKDVPYNLPEENNDHEITQLRLDPPDTFSKASPEVNRFPSTEKKNIEPETKSSLRKEAPITSVKNIAAAREESIKAPATAPPPEREQAEDIAKDYGNNARKEDKMSNESFKETSKSKKSASGMSNSKPATTQNSKQLSYPSQNNNSNQYSEVDVKSSDKSLTSSNDYENGKKAFKEGDFKKSISLFENALENAGGKRKEDIQFQLARAYLRAGKNRKARKLFEKLSEGSSYSKQATEELQKLTR